MATLPDTVLAATVEATHDVPAASEPEVAIQYKLARIETESAASGTPNEITFSPANDVGIGRDASTCVVAIPDNHNISRRHCRIFSLGRDVFVVDESSNGTWINGTLIGKGNRRMLRPGDVLAVVNPKTPESVKFSWRFVPPADGSPTGTPTGTTDDLLRQHYTIGKVLGTGNFATVYLGTKKTTGQQVAVKVIEKKRFALTQSNFSFDTLHSEVEILRKMAHKNIISIHDVFDDAKHFTMVLELVSNGDFFDYIVGRSPAPFAEADAKKLFVQLLEAMLYMHSKDVVHRDLKPENILVSVNPLFTIPHKTEDHQHNARNVPVEQVTLKVTDFGLAKFCGEQDVMTTMCGTPSYLAPEVINSKSANKAGYSWSVDVWSLGVILYIVLSGCPPKDPQNGAVAFNKYFANVSDEAKDIIVQMLKVNPAERADLSDICAHPWLKGVAIEGRQLAEKQDRLVLSGTVMIQPSPTINSQIQLTAGSAKLETATEPGDLKGYATDVESDGEAENGASASSSPAKARKRSEDLPAPGPRARWLWKKNLDLADSDAAAWQPYPEADSIYIEKAYNRGAKTCKIGHSGEYRVSFEGMFQYNTTETSKQRGIKRQLN